MFHTTAWYCIWISLISRALHAACSTDIQPETCTSKSCANLGGSEDVQAEAGSTLSMLQKRAAYGQYSNRAAAEYAQHVQAMINNSALDWVQMSATAACENSDPNIRPQLSKSGHTLLTCKTWCLESTNCTAIDFYETSNWCLLYDKACSKPSTVKDGSTSYRLVVPIHDIESTDYHPQDNGPIAQLETAPFPTRGSTIQEVFKFMTDFGSPWAAAQMKEDEIDGEAFLLLRTNDLKDYGMKKGPALKLSRRIQDAAVQVHPGTAMPGRHNMATASGHSILVEQEEETNALHEVVGPDGVLMISLDNKPERFAYASQQLKKAGIVPTKLSATDKDSATREELARGCPHQHEPGVKELCDAASRTGHGCATNIEQAIASSHLRALQIARKRQWEWTAIFEDDAVPAMSAEWSHIFRKAWKEIPPHTRIVRLGWCQIDAKSYPAPILEKVHTNVTGAIVTQFIGWGQPFQYEPGGCTTAYLVHQQIIADLLALFPCCGPVDSCLKWDFYKKINKRTGVEYGLEVMMNIDSQMDPVFDDAVEHHGLILQDRKQLWSQRA